MARKARQFRFYQAGEFSIGTPLQLDKAASHHLLTVLRASPGDQLELFNGDGYNYRAVLDSDSDGSARAANGGRGHSSKRAVITIKSRSPNLTESPLAITLVQAVSRGERMDQCIRQAVELGASAIQPVYSRQAQKPGDTKRAARKHEHWSNIILSATEQSGRAHVPMLHPARALSAWIEDRDNGPASMPCLLLHPAATHSFGTLEAMQQVSIAIGPESGFDDDEVTAMIQAGAMARRMGPRTLRTETAGPAAIAILQAIHGDGLS